MNQLTSTSPTSEGVFGQKDKAKGQVEESK